MAAVATGNIEDKNNRFSREKIGDGALWGIYITLILISIIESYSASSREISTAGIYFPILKHVVMLVLGFGIMVVMARIHYSKFITYIALFAVVSVALMVYVMLFGDLINGARRSITVAGFSIQPSEMAKLSIVTLISLLLAKTQMVKGVKTKGVFWSAFFVMLYGALLFKQGLTNTILLMSISISMMLIGGIQWKKLFYVFVIYAIFALGFMLLTHNNDEKEQALKANTEQAASGSRSSFTQDGVTKRSGTWSGRLARFKNSDSLVYQPINSINQQEMYAHFAQAHGGITGVGPGGSRECSRLPLAFSDYIFSIIVEETGAIGGIFVIILYLCLLARAGIIASKCSRALPALLIMGMAVMITFQALFHVAINTGVFPVSGQPLPLISKGGTSILIISAAFGVMLSVSRTAVQSTKQKEIREEETKLPENLRAANPYQVK